MRRNSKNTKQIMTVLFLCFLGIGWSVNILSRNTANMRDITIIADVKNNIGRNKNKKIDIMTGKLITGINSNIPLLVSTSIWNEFVKRRKEFDQRVQQKDLVEHDLYSLYKLVNQYLNHITQKNTYTKTELKNAITKQLSNEQTPIGALKDKIKNNVDNIIEKNLICFVTPFSNRQWSIYVISSFVLLVPNRYKNYIKQQLQYKITTLKEASNLLDIHLEELILGLKINRLEEKKFSNKYDLPEIKGSAILDTKTIEDDLHKIFVTKKDLDLPNMTDVFSEFGWFKYIPHTWNIYLSGHGGYRGKSLALEKQQQMLRALHEKVGYIHTALTPDTIQKFDEKYHNDLHKMMKVEKDLQ